MLQIYMELTVLSRKVDVSDRYAAIPLFVGSVIFLLVLQNQKTY